MADITITLTDAELNALKTIVNDPQEWILNFTKLRASKRLDEIVKNSTIRYLDESLTIPASKEEILADVIARGWYTYIADAPQGSSD